MTAFAMEHPIVLLFIVWAVCSTIKVVVRGVDP